MIDLKVDDDWQLTRAANGDAPLTSGSEELLQSIKLESMTQEGDLFYDLEYGWSLLDFMQSTDSELTKIAIQERIRSKMARRNEVDISSLQIGVSFETDVLEIKIQFRVKKNKELYRLNVSLDRIRVEVMAEYDRQ